MIIQKTKVKKIFNANGVQLSANTIESINREILTSISKMAHRCRENKVKRLTPDLMWCALGNYNLK